MRVTLQADAEPCWLAADKTIHLVRLAREALSNAERHGRARHATVTFQTQDGRGELWITDDGTGFNLSVAPTDERKHFGMSVMKARAASIGGTLRVESAPMRGARVGVEWQLQEEHSNASDGR